MNEKYIQFLPLVAKIQEMALLSPTDLPIFCYWSPHCGSIAIHIFKGAWDEKTNFKPVVAATAYLDWKNATEQLEALVKLIATYQLEAAVK